MNNLTINSGLALQKTLRNRLNELIRLRDSVAKTETTTYYTEPRSETRVDVKYDIKYVDKKVTELENVLFKLDSAIKTANAKTQLEIEVDVDKHLAPLE